MIGYKHQLKKNSNAAAVPRSNKHLIKAIAFYNSFETPRFTVFKQFSKNLWNSDFSCDKSSN